MASVRERIRRRRPRSRVDASNLAWWFVSRAWTRWIARSFDSLGQGTVVLLPCVIHGAERIRMGSHVEIYPMCRFGAIRGAHLWIGDHCEIAASVAIFA